MSINRILAFATASALPLLAFSELSMDPENLLEDLIPAEINNNDPEALYKSGWSVIDGNGDKINTSTSAGWSCVEEVKTGNITWGPNDEQIHVGYDLFEDGERGLALQYWDEGLLPQANLEENIAQRVALEYAHYVHSVNLPSYNYFFTVKGECLTNYSNGTLTPLNTYNMLLIAFSDEPMADVEISVDPDRDPIVTLRAGNENITDFFWKVLPRPKNGIPQQIEIPLTELNLNRNIRYINIFAPGQIVFISDLAVHKSIQTGNSMIESEDSQNSIEYYTLTGISAGNDYDSLPSGIYIEKTNGKSAKIVKN